MKFSLLINMKMPTIVGIFIFITRENFMLIVGTFIFISRENFILSGVEHEKSFMTSGPGKSFLFFYENILCGYSLEVSC